MAETVPSDRVSQEDIQRRIEEIEYTGRKTGPGLAKLLSFIAAVWSLFQLWIASPFPYDLGFGIITDVPARGFHLAFALLLTFLMFPAARSLADKRMSPLDILFALAGAFAALWVFIDQEGITRRLGTLMEIQVLGITIPFEAIVGGGGILLLLEATRRAIGTPLVIVAAVFLIYSIFGQSMPNLIAHKGVSLERLIGYQWMGGEAIFGIPIDVSVSFVFLFVLFGALLDRAGAGRYFLDLSFAMVGKYRGGPAKAAILASGMTGLISGSSIANVVTTGVFTIPVMRKSGMPAVKAGAIEVAASTNGQMMPPIMGAAAFIMAEFIGISYTEVVIAAAIPAFISYLGLLYISHLEALKLNLRGLSAEDVPVFLRTFLGGVHFIVPIIILVYLLMVEHWTASSSIFYTIVSMFLIMIGTRCTPSGLSRAVIAALYAVPIVLFAYLRYATTAGTQYSVQWGLALAAAFVIGLAVMRHARDRDAPQAIELSLVEIYGGLVAGARNMVGIAVAVATAGIIVGAVSSTGLNNAMVSVVEALSGGNIYVLLVLTAVLCIFLGMGLPTTANYLVVASLLAGVLVELGGAAGLILPLIAVHMFVFYFGLLADSTPPVCLAAFAASAISRADPLKTGVQAFMYDIRTAILPFVFIFNPQLLLIGVESVWHGLLIFVTSLIAVLCFASAVQGWMIIRATWLERLLLLVAMLGLFRPGFYLDFAYPEFTQHSLQSFAEGSLPVEEGRKIRLHAVRETEYGDRFKLFVFEAPADTLGQKSFGLDLEREPDGRYAVADIAFNSPAEQLKVDFGDYITALDVEQRDRPPKEIVYPLALLVLGCVILLQQVRRRRTGAAPVVRAGAE